MRLWETIIEAQNVDRNHRRQVGMSAGQRYASDSDGCGKMGDGASSICRPPKPLGRARGRFELRRRAVLDAILDIAGVVVKWRMLTKGLSARYHGKAISTIGETACLRRFAR